MHILLLLVNNYSVVVRFIMLYLPKVNIKMKTVHVK